MEEVIENCEALASTGVNQLLMILGAVLILAIAAAFYFTGRKQKLKFMIAALGILFSFSFMLAPVASYAQSVPEECVEESAGGGQTDEDDEEVSSLGLVDDAGNMQLPDSDSTETTLFMAILTNDTAPEGDSYDWSTLDLNTAVPGLQDSRDIPHPDDATYDCGDITHWGLGVISIQLNYTCSDTDFDTLTIDSAFTITPFDYIVSTSGAFTPDSPATVTIDVVSDLGLVISTEGDYDVNGDCQNPLIYNILDNDSTSIGTLDPATIDVDHTTPGIQQSVSFATSDDFGDYTHTLNVDEDGVISIVSDIPNATPTFFYTVQNTNGDTSQLTPIWGSSCL
jgi:hypothetical protein